MLIHSQTLLSLSLSVWLHHEACRILLPDQGSCFLLLQWKHRVLATRLPGKSPPDPSLWSDFPYMTWPAYNLCMMLPAQPEQAVNGKRRILCMIQTLQRLHPTRGQSLVGRRESWSHALFSRSQCTQIAQLLDMEEGPQGAPRGEERPGLEYLTRGCDWSSLCVVESRSGANRWECREANCNPPGGRTFYPFQSCPEGEGFVLSDRLSVIQGSCQSHCWRARADRRGFSVFKLYFCHAVVCFILKHQ